MLSVPSPTGKSVLGLLVGALFPHAPCMGWLSVSGSSETDVPGGALLSSRVSKWTPVSGRFPNYSLNCWVSLGLHCQPPAVLLQLSMWWGFWLFFLFQLSINPVGLPNDCPFNVIIILKFYIFDINLLSLSILVILFQDFMINLDNFILNKFRWIKIYLLADFFILF